MSNLILYCYCDGCGKKIMVGDVCYTLRDHLPDAEYSGLSFCDECCEKINTLKEWENWVDEQGGYNG